MQSFRQLIVVGGTGQTGHQVLGLAVKHPHLKIVATSRRIERQASSDVSAGGLPAGELASTVLGDVRRWGSKIQWEELDLEATPERLQSQMHQLRQGLSANTSTALVFAAAFTNVEGCETDPSRCMRVNETNTAAVLEWAKREFQAKLVIYSTDYVFDGAEGPYDESAPCNAESRYGQSKVFIEKWIERNAPDALVLRTTGVYDYLPGSKNFLMQMLDLWGKGQQTRIPSDQYSNPTWACELAQATSELLEKGASGIYGVAGGTYLARTEFAELIAHVFGFDPALITPIRTAELGQKAKRPLRGGLKCQKLEAELGWAMSPAKKVLKGFRMQSLP